MSSTPGPADRRRQQPQRKIMRTQASLPTCCGPDLGMFVGPVRRSRERAKLTESGGREHLGKMAADAR
jgi:hypothetical protein